MNSFEVDTTYGGGPDTSLTDDQTNHRNDNRVINDDDLFKTPDMFVRHLESLERKTFNGNDHSNATRKSLLKNFDPLIDPLDPSNDSFISKFTNMGLSTPDARTRVDINSHNTSVMSGQRNHNKSYYERTHNESSALLQFNSPLPVPPNTSASKSSTDHNDVHNHNNCDDFFANSFAQDYPSDNLSLQAKLIEKDQLIQQLQEKLNERDNDCQRYDVMVNLMHNCNQEVVEVAAEVIDNLLAEKNELIIKYNEMNGERTHAVEELTNVEKNFYEVHNRYDKVRNAVEEFKEKEEQFKEQIMELMDRLNEKDQMYELLKSKAEQKIDDANTMIEGARRECESEMIALKAQLKRSDMKLNGLQAHLDQKTKENDELTKMVDELIANVEK